MPEEAIAEAPVTTPPPPTSGGSDALIQQMQQMDSYMGSPIKEPPKESPKPDKSEPPKGGTPAKDTATGKFVKAEKVEPPKPPEKQAPAELRKAYESLKSEYETHKSSTAKQLSEAQAKMAELEKRPFLTKEQQSRYDALEKRAKELEANLYAQDYSQSPEYADKYQKRWQAKYAEAKNEVSSLKIPLPTQEGEEPKFRQATQADFERVRSIQSRAARLDAAEQLFGNRAHLVMEYCKDLDDIERAANEEISSKRANYESDMRSRMENQGKFQSEMLASAKHAEQQFGEKWPKWFGKSDDPEEQKAWEEGLAFVDDEPKDETPQQRGFRLATFRLFAASHQRNVFRINKLEKALSDAQETIKKLQGSDPGAEDGGAGGEKTESKPGGTAGLMADFADDKMR